MFRQPLFQILNIWSSQAPQALNIIQVVAKSTFPKLVGRLSSPLSSLRGRIWTRSPPLQAVLGHSPSSGRRLVRAVGVSVLQGTSEKPQGNGRHVRTRGTGLQVKLCPGGGGRPGTHTRAICQLVRERTFPVGTAQTAPHGLCVPRSHRLGTWAFPSPSKEKKKLL